MSGAEVAGNGAGGVTIEQEIRWGDMDALGHVNNIIYFQYCESARIAYFDAVGIDRFRERPTYGPGIVTASLNFRRQLRYPGKVRVTASVTKVGERSYTLSYVVQDAATGEVAAEGESVCVWVDYAVGKAMRLPDEMVEAIAAMEKNEELRRRGKA